MYYTNIAVCTYIPGYKGVCPERVQVPPPMTFFFPPSRRHIQNDPRILLLQQTKRISTRSMDVISVPLYDALFSARYNNIILYLPKNSFSFEWSRDALNNIAKSYNYFIFDWGAYSIIYVIRPSRRAPQSFSLSLTALDVDNNIFNIMECVPPPLHPRHYRLSGFIPYTVSYIETFKI